MLRRLVKQLYRDRRRYAVISILLFLSGAIEFYGISSNLPFLALEFIAGLGMVIIFGSLILALGLALPKWRATFLPLSFTLFAAACLGKLFPGSAFALTSLTEGGTRGIFGLFLTGAFVHFLFYGKWSDTLFKARRGRSTTRITLNLDNETAWVGLMPTPGRRECLHDPNVVSVDYTNRDRTEIRVIEWAPPADKVETILKIDEMKPGSYAVYRFQKPGKIPGMLETGLRAIRLVDMGDWQAAYITEILPNRPLRLVFLDWIDDALGRREDERAATLEQRTAALGESRQLKRAHLAIGGELRRTGTQKAAAQALQFDRAPAPHPAEPQAAQPQTAQPSPAPTPVFRKEARTQKQAQASARDRVKKNAA